MKTKICLAIKFASVLLFSIWLSGCMLLSKPEEVVSEKAFSKFLRATIYLENSKYKMRICGSTNINQLFDPYQFLKAHFFKDNEAIPSLYAEFDAVAADDLNWQLEELSFVSSSPQECGTKIQSLDFLATSKEGQWQAYVTDNLVKVSKQDVYTQLHFTSANHQNNKWQGEMLLSQGRRYKMSLQVKDGACIDDKEQWYRSSAIFNINGVTHKGCVRKGDKTQKFASGKYSNVLAIDNAFIVLNLAQDYSADLILDYRNGHPMIVSKGQWKMLSDNTLELNLTEQDLDSEQNIMLFEVFNSSELRLKGFSELLGSEGLKLLPIK